MKDVSILKFVLQIPFKFYTYMEFFEDFIFVLQMIFFIKLEKSILALRPHGKDRKYSRDQTSQSR